MASVFLATPPASLGERYGALASAGARLPSLGLLCVAAVLARAGHGVKIVDAAAAGLSMDQVVARARKFAPDVAGVSATTAFAARAGEMAGKIQAAVPGVRTALGGPHASACPEKVLEENPALDFAVFGEGEETFLDLVETLAAGRGPAGVPGLAFRDGPAIRKNAPRPLIRDLDALPFPAWELLPGFPKAFRPAAFKFRRLPAAHAVTSRGCPHGCVFCDRSVFGRRTRFHSPGWVLEMVERLSGRFGVRELALEDDRFLADPGRAAAICEGLLSRGRRLSFSVAARADQMDDPALLSLLARAGCWQVSLGVESGDPEVLARTCKGISLDQVRGAAARAKKAGLSVKGYFILGLPGETLATLARTLDFACELPLDDASAFFLTPFPGTEIFAEADRWGTLDPDFSRMNELWPVFTPHGLSRQELSRAARRFAARFYLRPRVVAGYARRAAANPALAPVLARAFFGFLAHVAGKGEAR
ncbi:MAG: B12-binding domain-containing radical SAM protein [Proteobacteria bacterium]|nr:B12-binding domain-containing radical SAM protein [Pseudomonadota bacterium]